MCFGELDNSSGVVVVFSVIMNFLVSAVTAFLRKEFHHCMHFYSSSPFYAHAVHNRRLTIKCVTNSTIEPFSNSSFFSVVRMKCNLHPAMEYEKVDCSALQGKIDFMTSLETHISLWKRSTASAIFKSFLTCTENIRKPFPSQMTEGIILNISQELATTPHPITKRTLKKSQSIHLNSDVSSSWRRMDSFWMATINFPMWMATAPRSQRSRQPPCFTTSHMFQVWSVSTKMNIFYFSSKFSSWNFALQRFNCLIFPHTHSPLEQFSKTEQESSK